jgi:hypothetical protein
LRAPAAVGREATRRSRSLNRSNTFRGEAIHARKI